MGGWHSMRSSVPWLLILALAITVPLPAKAIVGTGPTVEVNLRVEGPSQTIFEGNVRTRGHNVTTVSGGTHHCDGTNNHANPLPGPTPTTALADARRLTFDGTYDAAFDDFFITEIANVAQTATQFWGLLVNYQFTPVGGCEFEVHTGDQVLWAFDAFNAVHFLKLSGPSRVERCRPFQLKVIDGATGVPVSGAVVGGKTTDAAGIVTLSFRRTGRLTFKAELVGSVRSNSLTVDVSR